jgi:chemotaxis protein MotB
MTNQILNVWLKDTDNVPYIGTVLLDNWDLSVKRSTSIIRVLTNQLGVKPEQLIGRKKFLHSFSS